MTNLGIFKPRDIHWPVCRMLLPRTVEHSTRYEYRIAIERGSASILGAAAFIDDGKGLRSLQLHTVHNRRRQGVATQLLDHLAAEANKRKRGEISAGVNPRSEIALHAFLISRGLAVRDRLCTAEGDLHEIFARQLARCRRLADIKAADWQIIPLSPEMLADAGKLLAEHISRLAPLEGATYFVAPERAGLGLSQALVAAGALQGILLMSRTADTVTFEARAVNPAFRNTRASAMLLTHALKGAVETGASRLRFCYTNTGRDTVAVVKRLGLQVIDTVDHLVRDVGTSEVVR